jgi:hypothetical protein
MSNKLYLSQHSQPQYTCDINAPSVLIDARPVQMFGRKGDCTSDGGFWYAAGAVVALLGGARAR